MAHSSIRLWHSPSFRILVCLIFFVSGCMLSFHFLSPLGCETLPKLDYRSTPCSDRNHVDTPCSKGGNSPIPAPVPLVILIITAPGNIHKRHTLRRTWLSAVDKMLVKYFFVVGMKGVDGEVNQLLSSEMEHYADLLALPEVEEGYDNLTTKVLRSFVWIDKNLNFEHVLKVDDDSFVNSRRVLMELKGKLGDQMLYWGYFNGNAQVQQRGKWKDSEWNLCDRYLPYARGGGYILSRSAVSYLSQNALRLKIFKNEDVSVGLWLATLNIERVHDTRFDTEWESRGCSNEYLISHPHDEVGMQKLHDTLSTQGMLCSTEVHKRQAYIYDWSSLPSQCCRIKVLKKPKR